MKLRLGSAAWGGLVFGSLVYGSTISWCHVAFNDVRSAKDAVLILVYCMVFYGLAASVLFVAGRLGLASALWVGSRVCGWSSCRPEAGGDAPESTGRQLGPGLLLANLLFWELFFLHGLTYDEVPSAITNSHAMAGYLLLIALLVALPVAAACRLVVVVVVRLKKAGWTLRALGVGYMLVILLHLCRPMLSTERLDAADAADAAKPPPVSVEVLDTGVKVVCLAFDGADWRVMQPLLDRGELPHLSRLIDEGIQVDLETLPAANSAVIWASVYSGLEPLRHGVHDFFRDHLAGVTTPLFPVHRTYFRQLASWLSKLGLARRSVTDRRSLAAQPIWEVLDHQGLRFWLISGYLYSYPAFQPAVSGSYVISHDIQAAFALDSLATSALADYVQPISLFERLRSSLTEGELQWQGDSLLRLAESEPQPRFVSLYTHQPDGVQHNYWKWYEPEKFLGVDAHDVERFADKIPQRYRQIDDLVGHLRNVLDPNTAFVVISDHGHSPTMVSHLQFTEHRHGPPGILVLSGGPFRAGHQLRHAHVLDVFPTLLYVLGLPVPQDLSGRVWREALDDAFLAEVPLRTIPRVKDLWVNSESRPGDDEESRNRHELETLRSLGYIE